MKLYLDTKGERHYLLTDDGEAVYVDDLEEDGRLSEQLEQAINAAERGRRSLRGRRALGSLEEGSYVPD